ncbi:MAG: U32 family peptidase [Candidatus Gracilibacteria bacterium]|nr:U32 family peptidase [Candidatus Gracilibacteria bacterium]
MFKKIVGLGFPSTGKNAKDVKEYINTLVLGGATEFFTGYNPPDWYTRFGFEVSPNGRFAEHEQITSLETLKHVVDEVHSHNLEIFVNLNAWYYTDETFTYIKKMVDDFIEIGIDGIICGNIGIIEYLKSIDYGGNKISKKLKINISTIMALYNKEAIRLFLENYEINKIILSREVTLKEIESLVLEFPNVLFEVFGEGDFCRYNNGLCFAEHKYGAKDICTVVVNDLIIKKKFKADFKEIILDNNLSNQEKIDLLDDEYNDIFGQISSLLGKIDLGFVDIEICKKELYYIINISKNRIDLFFDAMKAINSQRNVNIFIYLRALKFLNLEEFRELEKELENSIKTGLIYLTNKSKEVGGSAKLKSLELGTFYSRSDNLNLYTYLFFSKFSNIETVKFPTRGRNSTQKLSLINQILESNKIDEKFLDRSISIERAHYDLTYLFGDKLWFRNMLKQFKI